MPEWLWIIGVAAVLGLPAVLTQRAIPMPAQVTGKSAESLAGTFQRCAVETRGTAKMWEDLDEIGLALLHQNLAVVWQNLCEVERQVDAPTPAPVATLVSSGMLTLNEVRSVAVEVHGYEYPTGCRCGTCWAEYQRRAAWPS